MGSAESINFFLVFIRWFFSSSSYPSQNQKKRSASSSYKFFLRNPQNPPLTTWTFRQSIFTFFSFLLNFISSLFTSCVVSFPLASSRCLFRPPPSPQIFVTSKGGDLMMQHFRRLLHIGANSNRTFVVEFSLTILFCVFPLTKQRVCLSSEDCDCRAAAVVTGELISRRWWCYCSDCSDDENVILMAISERRGKFDEEKSLSDEKSSSKFQTPWSCWQKKRWKWAKFSSIFSLLFAIILWFLLFLDSLLAAREWCMGTSLLAGCGGKSEGKLRVVQIQHSVWEENEEVFTSTWTSSDATQAALGNESGSNCCAIIRSLLDSLQMSFPRLSPLLLLLVSSSAPKWKFFVVLLLL